MVVSATRTSALACSISEKSDRLALLHYEHPIATVNKSLRHLERFDIVRELKARKRTRLYSYHRYVDIMNKSPDLSGS